MSDDGDDDNGSRSVQRPVPPPGSLGEAINVFFDRTSDLLPVWISKKWSIIISFTIASLILYISWPHIKELKETATTPLEHVQWIGTLMIVLLVTMMLQGKIADIVYSFAMISANKQHIANTHWLGEYVKAMRSTGTLLIPTTM